MEDNNDPNRPKIILRLVACVEGHPYIPVGPRYARGDPMPYANHYHANKGYSFPVDDYNEASECVRLLQLYIDKHIYEPYLDKQKAASVQKAEKTSPKGKQKELVATAEKKARPSIQCRRDRKM